MTNDEMASLAMEELPTLLIKKYGVKNEQGLPIRFRDHLFLYDIYNDLSPLQVLLKAPQVGATTMNLVKVMFMAKQRQMDAIYTLPTASDVQEIVGGKLNRIIAQNPVFMDWVKDHDTIEQKQVGDNLIYIRGTFTAKQAMMVTSRLNVHDEVDASNPQVMEQYETRLQAVSDGMRWYFSHPTLENVGIDRYWRQSDQKLWMVTCGSCRAQQTLTWPRSVDAERGVYVCKACGHTLSDDERRVGVWRATAQGKFSGYWVSQLMCPWITAAKIVDDFQHKDAQYFWNYVLGLPYADSTSKLSEDDVLGCCSSVANDQGGRVIIGVDTGLPIWYVCGNDQGLFFHGHCKGYDELDLLMVKWPRAIMVADQGGDLIGIRALQVKYPGRVFLCYFQSDKASMELSRWGEGDEYGTVKVDRNRSVSMLAEQLRDRRIVLNGSRLDWHQFWLHANAIYREVEETSLGVDRYVWRRTGADHLVMAAVYWMAGMQRYGGTPGGFVEPSATFTVGAKLRETSALQLLVPLRAREPDWREV
jgi:hypothetical protein